jgi:hypothetical protein
MNTAILRKFVVYLEYLVVKIHLKICGLIYISTPTNWFEYFYNVILYF